MKTQSVVLVLAALWTLRQFDYQSASVWMRYGTSQSPARVWPADQPLSHKPQLLSCNWIVVIVLCF